MKRLSPWVSVVRCHLVWKAYGSCLCDLFCFLLTGWWGGRTRQHPKGRGVLREGRGREAPLLACLIDNTTSHSFQPGTSLSTARVTSPKATRVGWKMHLSQLASCPSTWYLAVNGFLSRKRTWPRLMIWEVHLEDMIHKDGVEEEGLILS